MSLPPTPGQTIGPFFGEALPFAAGPQLVPASDPGAIRLHGTVRDGAGDGVPDALVELWQPDATGEISRASGSLPRGGGFTGWGRAATDASGRYEFTTLRPGGAAPCFLLAVFARGLLDRLVTRAYLPDHPALDEALAWAPADRRDTLVARADADGYAFDLVLQGDAETVFLTYSSFGS